MPGRLLSNDNSDHAMYDKHVTTQPVYADEN